MHQTDLDKMMDAYFTSFPRRYYPRGQIILFADETPSRIHYLAQGVVRVYDVSYRGEEVIVNLLEAPSCFPLSTALNSTPVHFFYKAEVDCVTHLVPREDLMNFLRSKPDLLLRLMGRLHRNMDGTMGRLAHLMSGTARSRLIYELVLECRRFGIPQLDNTQLILVNESDLASRAGLSRETVSREMKKLRENNWVDIRNRSIRIKDLAALEQNVNTLVPF